MAFFTASDGCRIYYDLFGKQGAFIVLIPGLGGDGRFWNGVVQELQSNYRLLVIDHRGAGRSQRPQGDYSLRQIAADVAAIIKITGQAAHIVGHSAGGAIAQELALTVPELGLSYIISSSWARADARLQAIFTARAEMLEAGQVHIYQKLSHVFCYDDAYFAAHEQELAMIVNNAPALLAPLSVASARVRMLLAHDRLDDLTSIVAPVHIVAADGDILIPASLSAVMAERITGAKFVTVKGAHFHPKTHPLEFACLIHHFLSEQRYHEGARKGSARRRA